MNKNKTLNLPIFMQDPKTNEVLKEVISAVPKNTKAYIVGGAVRNALYYNLFHKKLPHRDYDIVVIGNRSQFIKNLRSKGFIYGKIRRKHEITLKKKKIAKPKHEFDDCVFLDLHFSEEKSIMKNLREVSGFTINAFALSLKQVVSKGWQKKVIAHPNALTDLKKKQLRVNALTHPAMLFACIRFMSQGFKAPSEKQVNGLLLNLRKFPKYKFKRNIKKIFSYVGGEKKARQLTKKLGIKEDIFEFKTIKNLRRLN